MDLATEKQIVALKGMKNNPVLSEQVLSQVDVEQLSKDEASRLISLCKEIASSVLDGNGDFILSFSQNFRKSDGSFGSVILSEKELGKVR